MIVALLLALACSGPAPTDTASCGEDCDTAADTETDTADTADTADLDSDADGWTDGEDCDALNPAVHPGAVEDCDGLDNDCDGTIDDGLMREHYADADGDGWAVLGTDDYVLACGASPAGYTTQTGDCNDAAADIYPGAPDDNGDLEDDDCDGETDEDYDACAVAWGSIAFWTERYEVREKTTYSLMLLGDATVCDVTCDKVWTEFRGMVTDGHTACSLGAEPLPYTVSDGEGRVCVAVLDHADEPATCTARTSAGYVSIELAWSAE